MKTGSTIKILILILMTSLTGYHYSKALDNNAEMKQDSLKSISTILSPIVSQTFGELKVPGAIVGVFIGGYEPYIESFGAGNLESKKPITADDKMRIGSITKTFTGTVLMQLVGEGKISLSDKLSTYFPDYPDGDKITIQELADMRSGIFNYTEDTTFSDALMKNMDRAYTPVQLIAVADKHPMYFPPGSSFHYSNTNIIFLGLIIEKITGNPLQVEIRKRILEPLGMKNTELAVNMDFPGPHAHGYMYLDSTSSEPADVTYIDPSCAWSAGSMISTLSDLSLYVKPLATGQLIGEKMQEERLDWKTSEVFPSGQWKGKTLKYGVCIASIGDAIGHNGEIMGFNGFIGYIPEKDASLIVLANMEGNKEGIAPADYIAMKIIDALKTM